MQQGAGNVAVPATGGVAIRYTQDSDTKKEAIMQQGETGSRSRASKSHAAASPTDEMRETGRLIWQASQMDGWMDG